MRHRNFYKIISVVVVSLFIILAPSYHFIRYDRRPVFIDWIYYTAYKLSWPTWLHLFSMPIPIICTYASKVNDDCQHFVAQFKQRDEPIWTNLIYSMRREREQKIFWGVLLKRRRDYLDIDYLCDNYLLPHKERIFFDANTSPSNFKKIKLDTVEKKESFFYDELGKVGYFQCE